MGYHKNNIEKGDLGTFSKITEEYQELEDAVEQANKILMMCECADLIGAIEAFAVEKLGVTLEELIEFKNLTKSAFEDGSRT